MVRPRGIRHDIPVASSNVRISRETKQSLTTLMKSNNYQTFDECIRFLLSQGQGQLTRTTEQQQPVITRDMLQHPEVDKLIKSVSKEVYRKSQTPTQRPTQRRQSKSKPKPK